MTLKDMLHTSTIFKEVLERPFSHRHMSGHEWYKFVGINWSNQAMFECLECGDTGTYNLRPEDFDKIEVELKYGAYKIKAPYEDRLIEGEKEYVRSFFKEGKDIP